MDEMDSKQFIMTMRQIADEKNLDYKIVEEALEQAIAAAYRKDFGDRDQEVRATLNQKTGDFKIYVTREAVTTVDNPHLQISLSEAQKSDKAVAIGGQVEQRVSYEAFGRVAAQTAKQVILQKLREAERDAVFAEYQDKVGTLINGTVQRIEPRLAYIDVGKAQGIMPLSEQIPRERLHSTQRLKVYLRDVEYGPRGPQLILSRARPEFISLLFEREVPEMENGAVEIKKIAREAGVRTKLAVVSTVPGVDPVGTFVGGHGTRVQAVMNEVGEEKIDIIPFAEQPMEFIKNALAPTQVTSIKLDTDKQSATVEVAEDQLSVAIGRQGQNVRLASKLSGWQIDIVTGSGELRTPKKTVEPSEVGDKKERGYVSKNQIESSLLETLSQSGGTEKATETSEKSSNNGN